MHGANPPGYRNWAGLQLPMPNASIAAAKAAGARLIVPGTVYNFGPDAFPTLTEATPAEPRRPARARSACRWSGGSRPAAEAGHRVLIVRAGDFFGPATAQQRPGWLAAAGRGRLTGVPHPGPLGVGHGWAYLPDLGETMVRLVDAETGWRVRGLPLPRPLDRPTAGDGRGDARRAGKPKLPVSRLPWFAVGLAAPFNETFREMLEMRYLWQRPIRLEQRQAGQLLGVEPHTPIEAALCATLTDMGCLDDAALVAPQASRANSAMAPAM